MARTAPRAMALASSARLRAADHDEAPPRWPRLAAIADLVGRDPRAVRSYHAADVGIVGPNPVLAALAAAAAASRGLSVAVCLTDDPDPWPWDLVASGPFSALVESASGSAAGHGSPEDRIRACVRRAVATCGPLLGLLPAGTSVTLRPHGPDGEILVVARHGRPVAQDGPRGRAAEAFRAAAGERCAALDTASGDRGPTALFVRRLALVGMHGGFAASRPSAAPGATEMAWDRDGVTAFGSAAWMTSEHRHAPERTVADLLTAARGGWIAL